jgi:hypothetical protein
MNASTPKEAAGRASFGKVLDHRVDPIAIARDVHIERAYVE